MATIVNTTPANQSDSGSGTQFLLGAILLLIALFLFFYYGLPAMRNAAAPVQQSGTSIEVPDQIDVNVSGSMDGQQPDSGQ